MLAWCRNVKAAKAVLDDHDGDVEALKARGLGCSRMRPRSKLARPAFPMRGRRPMKADEAVG